MDKTLLLVNGPNLNLLGTREPDKYGTVTLAQIEERIVKKAKLSGYEVTTYQSNSEGEIVTFIQQNKSAHGLMINAGAYTHTSVAIRDAVLSVGIPCVELHLSNIFKRESFRHHSYLTDISIGIISGFGDYSYDLALQGIINYIENRN